MPDDSLLLEVAGKRYEGWKSVSVTLSMESIAGTFDLAITERWPDQPTTWPIMPGERCKILIGDVPVITGYVDVNSVRYDAQSHEVSVKGRDATGDLVDCSADSDSYTSLNFMTIATRLCAPYGINVIDLTGGAAGATPIPQRSIQEGETVFRSIERLAQIEGVLLVSDGLGNLFITRAGAGGDSATVLKFGENIISASGEFNQAELFSDITVKGQSSAASAPAFDISQASPAHTVSAPGARVAGSVKRRRPLIVIAEAQVDIARCRQRAEWEAATREAKARRNQVTVHGWRQDDGTLWKINQRVRLVCPYLRSDGWWLIAGVTYKLDDSGTTTELTLTGVHAYDPQPYIPEAGTGVPVTFDVVGQPDATPAKTAAGSRQEYQDTMNSILGWGESE